MTLIEKCNALTHEQKNIGRKWSSVELCKKQREEKSIVGSRGRHRRQAKNSQKLCTRYGTRTHSPGVRIHVYFLLHSQCPWHIPTLVLWKEPSALEWENYTLKWYEMPCHVMPVKNLPTSVQIPKSPIFSLSIITTFSKKWSRAFLSQTFPSFLTLRFSSCSTEFSSLSIR